MPRRAEGVRHMHHVAAISVASHSSSYSLTGQKNVNYLTANPLQEIDISIVL